MKHRIILGLLLILSSQAYGQLTGLYTVHPQAATGGTNFATLNDAITALQTQGVSGPVSLQVFDDGGPWTEANPVTTIINPGTAVISIQGNLITGLSAANRVTIEAFPGEFPVLDATGQNFGIQMVTCQYFTIKGFEVFGATVDGISCYADGASGASGALLGNELIGNRIHDIAGCGMNIYANLGTTAWFDGTVVRNNFFWSCQITNGGGNASWRHGYLNERRSINAVIENNTFYADTGAGTQFGVIATQYSLGTGGPAASVRNNLLVKTVAIGELYRHVEAGSIAVVMDNNFYDDTSGGAFMGGASGAFATLGAFQAANPTLEAFSFTGTAGLANPAGGDLHLTLASVVIDAGATIVGITDDIDGDARPQGIAFDIGADEFVLGGGLTLAMTQAAGPGTPISIVNSGLTPGNEYYSLFSLDVCPSGPGTGPYSGLCIYSIANYQFMFDQLMSPLGTPPIHFAAPSSYATWGPFSLPPLTVDAFCLDVTGGTLGQVSPVTRMVIQ